MEGEGWSCTGKGDTEVTCTTSAAIPPGGEAKAILIEADTAGIKEGELLVNHVSISGGDAAEAQTSFESYALERPAAVTAGASDLKRESASSGSATLNAAVNPGGGYLISCEFEYGTTSEYGAQAPCSQLLAPERSSQEVSASVTLEPGTVYHFRIVAVNALGTSEGADGTVKIESPEEEAAAKKRAEEEAAAKKRAEEEAAAKSKTEEEAAAAKKVEEEAATTKRAEAEAATSKKAAEEAAAAKKAAEEAATKKRAEETAAKTGVLASKEQGGPNVSANVALAGSTVTVHGSHAAVKLTCTGTMSCIGKLALTVKESSGSGKRKHMTTRRAGSAVFSVPAGETVTVELVLSSLGHSMLAASHGHLGASLTISKSTPAPANSQTRSVVLVLAKGKKK